MPQVRSYEEEGVINPAAQIGQFRFGLDAPSGTPAAITERLEAALKAALDLPDVRAKLLEMGLDPTHIPGKKVKEMTANEIVYWRKIANITAIRLD